MFGNWAIHSTIVFVELRQLESLPFLACVYFKMSKKPSYRYYVYFHFQWIINNFQESVIIVYSSHLGQYVDKILWQSLLVLPWKFPLWFYRPFYRTSGTSPQVYIYDVMASHSKVAKPHCLHYNPLSCPSLNLLAIWSSRIAWNLFLLAIHCFAVLYVTLLCGYLYITSHRRLFRGALSMTGRWKERSSNNVETQVISPVASHSGVQEERHSRVQDPLQERPGSGIEKYGTHVQEDHREPGICTLQLWVLHFGMIFLLHSGVWCYKEYHLRPYV